MDIRVHTPSPKEAERVQRVEDFMLACYDQLYPTEESRQRRDHMLLMLGFEEDDPQPRGHDD